MARLPFRGRRQPEAVDEFGGVADGSLQIADSDGQRLHLTPVEVAASIRFLLARVQHSDSALPPRLAVTSALRGEGVTFVTRSLASVLVYDSPENVVVVSLDWESPDAGQRRRRRGRRSTASEELGPGAASRPTLIDAVEERASVDDILQPTANPRLQLVAPGSLAPQRRTAVAGSPELEKLLDEVASRFDRVLLDLPPVMASSDAITLSHLADAFLLVVRHGVTTESQVSAALEELRSVLALGVVLNRFDSSVPRSLRRILGG